MEKTIKYLGKGTTVYYFDSFDIVLKETIVEDLSIKIVGNDEVQIFYTLDSGKKNVPSFKLSADRVFADREELKRTLLNNFEKDSKLVAKETSATEGEREV